MPRLQVGGAISTTQESDKLALGTDGGIDSVVRHLELALTTELHLAVGDICRGTPFQPNMVRTTPQQNLYVCCLPLRRASRRQVAARSCVW